MTQHAEEGAVRGDFLPNCRAHPDSDQHGFRVVVAEQLSRRVLANSQRSGRKNANAAGWDLVKLRSDGQEFGAGAADICCYSRLHCRINGLRNHQELPVLW